MIIIREEFTGYLNKISKIIYKKEKNEKKYKSFLHRSLNMDDAHIQFTRGMYIEEWDDLLMDEVGVRAEACCSGWFVLLSESNQKLLRNHYIWELFPTYEHFSEWNTNNSIEQFDVYINSIKYNLEKKKTDFIDYIDNCIYVLEYLEGSGMKKKDGKNNADDVSDDLYDYIDLRDEENRDTQFHLEWIKDICYQTRNVLGLKTWWVYDTSNRLSEWRDSVQDLDYDVIMRKFTDLITTLK